MPILLRAVIWLGVGISEQFRSAFAEDKEILEAVQAKESLYVNRSKIGLELDASAGLFRKKIDRLLRDEVSSAVV